MSRSSVQGSQRYCCRLRMSGGAQLVRRTFLWDKRYGIWDNGCGIRDKRYGTRMSGGQMFEKDKRLWRDGIRENSVCVCVHERVQRKQRPLLSSSQLRYPRAEILRLDHTHRSPTNIIQVDTSARWRAHSLFISFPCSPHDHFCPPKSPPPSTVADLAANLSSVPHRGPQC